MPSRQTIHNRRTDAARLQAMIDAALLHARVQYDERRGGYVVRRVIGAIELVAGRYEVVYAWLRGYSWGKLDVEQPPATTEEEIPDDDGC